MLQNFKRQGSGCKEKKQYRKADYKSYQYSVKEWILYGTEGIVLVWILGYFFYRSIIGICLLSPLILFFLKLKRDDLCIRRKNRLNLQFKDMLTSLKGSLQAGYSLENAFLEAYEDMVHFHGKGSIIAMELAGIKTGIYNNRPVEELVQELGERSDVEDIRNFGNVLQTGKKSGGNLNEIIQTCISVTEEKLETKQEIQTLISSKKLEAGIMSVIPLFMILYMDITSPGYFDTLYQTIGGNVLMSVCLGVYLTAIGLSIKITRIEI